MIRAVGGVMPAEPGGAPVAGSVLERWSAGWSGRAAFANAGSALAALLAARQVRRVWTPAYVCPVVTHAIAQAGAEARFYGVDPTLNADPAAIGNGARSGDAVVGVDNFGRPPGAAFLELRERLGDLLWIEDCAQALDTGAAPWGDAALYSPRKLVGIGDGGLLFAKGEAPGPTAPALDLWSPEDARAQDVDGHAPERWYGLFKAREAGMRIGVNAMSARSLAALEAIPAGPIANVRRANWRTLAAALGDFALWSDPEPAFAPLAFPIVVEDAAAAVAVLAEERIWAPRHWADLPSDAQAFPDAHALSRQLVSLPCDQRYGAADMARVTEVVRRRLQPR